MDLDLQTGEAKDLYLTFDHGKAQATVTSVKYFATFRLVKPSVAIETSMCFVATLHRLSIRHKAQV